MENPENSGVSIPNIPENLSNRNKVVRISKPWKRLTGIAAAALVAASTGYGPNPIVEAQSSNTHTFTTVINNSEAQVSLPFQVLKEKMPTLIDSKRAPSDMSGIENNMPLTGVFQEGHTLKFIQESAVNKTINNSGYEMQLPSSYIAEQIYQVNDSLTLVSGKQGKSTRSLLFYNQTGIAKILEGRGIALGGKVYLEKTNGLYQLNLDNNNLGPRILEGDIKVVGSTLNENSNQLYVIHNNHLLKLTQEPSGSLKITTVNNNTSNLIDASVNGINGNLINTLQEGSDEPYIINIGNNNVDFRSLEDKALELLPQANNGETPPLLKLNHAPIMLDNNALGVGIMENDVYLYALPAENNFNYPQMTQVKCPLVEMKGYRIQDAQIININGSNIATLTVLYVNNKNNIRKISYGVYVTPYGGMAYAPLVLDHDTNKHS